MCPDKVEKAVWEKVLELRERRLDHDEVSAEFKASIDRLQKENDQLQKKEKQASTEQKAIEAEIEAFQNEKQEKFNALDVVVMLRLDQIQCLVNEQLPVDQVIRSASQAIASMPEKIEYVRIAIHLPVEIASCIVTITIIIEMLSLTCISAVGVHRVHQQGPQESRTENHGYRQRNKAAQEDRRCQCSTILILIESLHHCTFLFLPAIPPSKLKNMVLWR